MNKEVIRIKFRERSSDTGCESERSSLAACTENLDRKTALINVLKRLLKAENKYPVIITPKIITIKSQVG
jgi:hypothetical protein